MADLLNCCSITKSYGAHILFQDLTLSVAKGDRIGIIGPNGAGKSTLLRVLARRESPDSGELSVGRDLKLAFLSQEERYSPADSVWDVLHSAAQSLPRDEQERAVAVSKAASQFGLKVEAPVSELSGGWRRRLAIAAEILKQPELLILDEPTNHLDIEGVQSLERLLSAPSLTLLVVSHDRTFLENATTRILEINPRFPSGFFCVSGNYSFYLKKRDEYLTGLQRNEASLANRVRHEMDWLRRGPKARSTKARARIDEANNLIAVLREYQGRSRSARCADIKFSATGRKTKRLISVSGLAKSFGGNLLFADLDFVLTPGMRLGLLGENGSGKSTLLKILSAELEPDAGLVERAPNLKVVHFEQERESLNLELSLKQTLAPEGDFVFYQGQSLHIASYAARFLFSGGMLHTMVGALSGGEKARLLIARLMLQPADVLLLDEPTNDLDIDTLEVLEESLEEFVGALVLVTHDRLMLDRIANVLIGLDREVGAALYAEYPQWLEARRSQRQGPAPVKGRAERQGQPRRRKLSYLERQELQGIEEQIESAEARVAELELSLADREIAADAVRCGETYQALDEARHQVNALYLRWGELEALK